jgi:SAM-dependent methyltransferase
VSAATPPLFRASAQDDESVAQMVAVLDAQDSLPAARRLHDWAIETAAVRAGDQVVDLGSGTGTLSKRLAGLVAAATSPPDGPMGWVTGVEPNARLRAIAMSRAERDGVRNVAFIDGLAGELPLSIRASISSGASAYCNTSAIRKRRSMTSPGCYGLVVVRCCWMLTRGPESFQNSVPTSPRHSLAHR